MSDYVQKPVKLFDKGMVDEIGDESIPAGTASFSNNFLDLGDRIELVRGQFILGNRLTGAGKSYGLGKGRDVEENEYLYRKRGTLLERFIPASNTWTTVITGLPADEDLSFVPYRTPAGSFLWMSSPNSGLYRINLANPDSYVDLYDPAKNHRGYITVQDNRMWLVQKVQSEAVVFLSFVDDDFPYTDVTAENIGTGNGVQTTFTDTLSNALVAGRLLTVTAGAVTGNDNGNGIITGTGISGTINYTTGAISVTFTSPVPNLTAITVDYSYEQPKTRGLADFTYSATRLPGEGAFFFQGQGNDRCQFVLPYDEKFYIPHDETIWIIDLGADDTDATNKIYREGTGIPNFRAAVSTGDGIYYIDDANQNAKSLRLLKYNDISSRVLPASVSDQLDLDSMVFDDAACIEFNDYVIWACKSSSEVSYNDTLLLYNKRWKLLDKMDATYRCFTIYNDKLYGGSSVDNNVYELFSGFDDDEEAILGDWRANDWTLDIEELKRCKRFIVEGDMATSQELIVEIAYDGDDFQEIGRIAGTSQYVDSSESTQYGTTLYGSGDSYGSGEFVLAFRYMREFKLRSQKFYRIRVRFRTEEIGYLNIRQYNFRDVRSNLPRIPSKFR